MNSLEKVFITGSSGGIGSAITKKFIDVGYKLILISSSKEKLSTMKNEYGDHHSYYHLDLSDLSSITSRMNEISNEHPDISIVINNAGMTSDSLLLRMKLEQWQEVINTNLSSNFALSISLRSINLSTQPSFFLKNCLIGSASKNSFAKKIVG